MTTETDAERIARRYPPRRGRRWWVVAAVVLAAVLGSWLVWTATHHANPPVAGHVAAFDVVSDTQIDVTVTVQRTDPAQPARCEVTTQAVTYDTVGQLPFDVPPGTERLTTVKVSVNTFKRATTADVAYCRPA
ncbi:DUF4307 domain-containing protein [Nigerium massiliense]|uniref:DUF4307 domain-containing protein n=1 Tax=Nigerium massiliense TaxID=1522317 RepID=UPI0012FD35FB|nr:DUF4307 domain-containing protein [Nigerium massiliense]